MVFLSGYHRKAYRRDFIYGLGLFRRDFLGNGWERSVTLGIGWFEDRLWFSKLCGWCIVSKECYHIYIYSRVFLVYDFIDLLGLGCRKSHWIFPSFSLQPIQILFNQGTRFACAHRTSSPLFLPSPLSYGSLTDSFISHQNNKITTFQLPMSSSFNLTSL